MWYHKSHGALAQLGAHNTGSVGVRGSNPLCSTNKKGTLVYQKFLFCLSKPQAWYIIAARSAVHIINGGSPPLYLITRQRASTCGLMICNASHWWYTATSCGWYTRLRRDWDGQCEKLLNFLEKYGIIHLKRWYEMKKVNILQLIASICSFLPLFRNLFTRLWHRI